MRKLREWSSRLWGTLRRQRSDRELEEELQAHLELAAEDLGSRGNLSKEATRAIQIEARRIPQVMESLREQRGLPWLEDVMRDLQLAMRAIRHNPGFTMIAILTLALGIGATTALFSLVNTVLLTPLPVQNPQRLIVLSLRSLHDERFSVFSYPLFSELQSRNHTLSGIFASTLGDTANEVRVPPATEIEAARVTMVSGNFFEDLGIDASLGRVISRADDNPPGGHAVVVLSNRFWKQRFGASTSILGKTIIIGQVTFTVIGVAPPGFFGNVVGEMPDMWVPATMQPQLLPPANFLETASTDWLMLMGRLRPGVSLSQAQADLDGVLQQIQLDWKGTANGKGLPAKPKMVLIPGDKGFSELRERFVRPLEILMAVVGLVLLIACVNVANLLSARVASRDREIAVRVALGASAERLARQFLTESLFLSVLGGLAGLVLSLLGTRALLPLLADRGGAQPLAVHLDMRLLVFSALVSVAAGLLFGVLPAAHATKNIDRNLQRKDSTNLGTPARFGKILVVWQVAISLVLVTCAGLFLRTLENLRLVDTGFDREHLLLFRVDPLATGYKGAQLAAFNRRLRLVVSGVPGVQSVSQSAVGLMQGRSRLCCISVSGYKPAPGERMAIRTNDVLPTYFDTVGMRIIAGSDFNERDVGAKLRPVVVNEAFAKQYFGAVPSAVGKLFGFERTTQMQIIGVVHDAHYDGLRQPSVPMVFFPLKDDTAARSLEIRTASDPRLLASAVRHAVSVAEPRLPVREMLTIKQLVDASLAQEILLARVSGFFGLLALGMACLGIYGLLTFLVVRRVPEIGIRVAIGATRIQVVRMILAEIGLLVTSGIVVGLPVALITLRLIASQLFGLGSGDPLTIAAATLVIAAGAITASLVPALRAASVDPAMALRAE